MPALSHQYNVGMVSKRARGSGRITAVTGMDRLMADYGSDVVLVDLLPIGSPRRDWRATTVGDGLVMVRHPELQRVIEMTERFAAELQLHAQ
ncbi:MAG TPA: hypothetical protein VFD59_16320 [Nocardioidaceae bacterium]|nr:hypothetical protein [Nocardioidaceae bacterium]